MHRRVISAGLLLVTLTAAAASARAQGLDGERFAPAAGAAGGFFVERPVVPGHLGYGLGLFLHFADDSLVLRDRVSGAERAKLLDAALSADLLASLGLFDWLELALHLPVRLIYQGDAALVDGGALAAGAGMGDLRLVPKMTLLHEGDERGGFVLGAALPVTLPTGSATALRGSGGLTVEPRLLALAYGARWYLAGSLGLRVRDRKGDHAPGNELTFGLAGTMSPGVEGDWLDLQLELVGGFLPGLAGRALANLPLELLGGAIFRPALRWSIYAGAGAGISNGIAVPDWRLIAGVRYTVGLPTRGGRKDSDGDGITDKQDRCPEAAEDLDGFEDNDGCPEQDNDRDGILDDDDECPDDAEEPNGDKDGCPDRARIVIRKGQVIVYGKVQFQTGKTEISPKSEQLIDDMAKLLEGHKQTIKRLEIQGHTDSTGSAAFNLKLSQERAENVKAALIKRGVAERRLTAKGYGESMPVAPNFTNAGRAKNRRVEFAIQD